VPKRTVSYRADLLQSLTNPIEAASYLNAAMGDSLEMFLDALKDVAQAHQIAKVAKEAGVARESLYRSLSNQGNPTLEMLHSVLKALKLRIEIASGAARSRGPVPKRRSSEKLHLRNIAVISTGQMGLFPEIANLATEAVPVASRFVRPMSEKYKSVPVFANAQDVTNPPYIANFQNIAVGAVQVVQ
jgi:probable addiction module antidote protein